jgi:hypothetical protein
MKVMDMDVLPFTTPVRKNSRLQASAAKARGDACKVE